MVYSDVDPVLLVSWSDNGGKTWSPERSMPLGRLGDYTRRAKLTRAGTGNSVGRTFRIRISAGVARAIQAMWADVEKLPP